MSHNISFATYTYTIKLGLGWNAQPRFFIDFIPFYLIWSSYI